MHIADKDSRYANMVSSLLSNIGTGIIQRRIYFNVVIGILHYALFFGSIYQSAMGKLAVSLAQSIYIYIDAYRTVACLLSGYPLLDLLVEDTGKFMNVTKSLACETNRIIRDE